MQNCVRKRPTKSKKQQRKKQHKCPWWQKKTLYLFYNIACAVLLYLLLLLSLLLVSWFVAGLHARGLIIILCLPNAVFFPLLPCVKCAKFCLNAHNSKNKITTTLCTASKKKEECLQSLVKWNYVK